MAACDEELSGLPLLSGCPGNNEYFLVGNAIGGKGVGLYGRRLWSDIKSCAASAIKYAFSQFVVGQVGAPIPAGQTTLVIAIANIIAESVFITKAGPELPQDDNTQFSYDVTLSSSNMVLIFNQAVQNGEQYIIHYAYIG